MRHYFGYDINGSLRSLEAYGPAGWPSTHCMEDPACAEAAITSLRESRALSAPEVIDWVLYDCPCDPGQGALLKNCTCPNAMFSTSHVDTVAKTLSTKPLQTIYIDTDVIAENRSVVTKAPGTQVLLKLVSSGMPDGETVQCHQSGAVDVSHDDAWELVFSNGTTDSKMLITPPQGTKGIVSITGRLVRPFVFALRGFEIA